MTSSDMARRPRRRRHATIVAFGLAALVAALQAQAPSPHVDPALLNLINSARSDIDQYWRRQMPGYTPPTDVVVVQAPTETDCGKFEKPNARYCASTNKIYWDVGLFTTAYQLGDFAPIFILAHEWGHLVQRQLGFDRTTRGLITVQLELQADCLAGAWSHDAKRRGLLDPGDDDEAVLMLRRGGDKLNAPWFEPNAHGSPGQRVDAFLYGFEGTDCAADGFFAFLKERGIDPSRVQQAPTPDTGSLAQNIKKQVGRFTLASTRRTEIPLSTDAIEATYKTPDGVPVVHLLVAYKSAADASAALDRFIPWAKQQGYAETKRQDLLDTAGIKLGTVVVLHGPKEMIIWNNKQFIGGSEGPRDVAWELYNALPY